MLDENDGEDSPKVHWSYQDNGRLFQLNPASGATALGSVMPFDYLS